jgi:hypothetical protein
MQAFLRADDKHGTGWRVAGPKSSGLNKLNFCVRVKELATLIDLKADLEGFKARRTFEICF